MPEENSSNPRLQAIKNAMPLFESEFILPSELEEVYAFESTMAKLNEAYSQADLEGLLINADVRVTCLVLAALARRSDEDLQTHKVLRQLDINNTFVTHFCLQTLLKRVPPETPLVGAVISRNLDSWTGDFQALLDDFIEQRVEQGEEISEETLFPTSPSLSEEGRTQLLLVLKRAHPRSYRRVSKELSRFGAKPGHREEVSQGAETEFSLGRVWSKRTLGDHGFIDHEQTSEPLERLVESLKKGRHSSFVIAGQPGVGKTSLIREIARRVSGKLRFLEVAQDELVAGEGLMGTMEKRLQTLLAELAEDGETVLYLPDIHEYVWAGQHMHSTVGLLDLLMRAMESRGLIVIGETDQLGLEQLLRDRPRAKDHFQIERLTSVTPEVALDVALQSIQRRHERHAGPTISQEVVREAAQLASQYMSDLGAPGSVLRLLNLAIDQRTKGARRVIDVEVSRDDVMEALRVLTGLSAVVLDDQLKLNLDRTNSFFEKRVLGQPEATTCLIDRIAMIKAGLGDSTRPLGVFLFAGPTGTGKIELAKALAEFLFGDPNRMVRLDMSELQSHDAMARIFGGAQRDASGASLTERIRQQPFSVVLLDEFEKAPAEVWNMFLQVFDDGRLTDNAGRTADLRHAIIILTTNLGGKIPGGATLGFTKDHSDFRPEAVERAIIDAFPREFFNRIDRMLVFRPLSRQTMRQILDKELKDVSRRRGLRWRDWAIEWDESAFEFLLERGITRDLGARPLRRAIERYFLTPLSRLIAQGQAPHGDQFLFVRAKRGQLVLDFVDPDAPFGEVEESARVHGSERSSDEDVPVEEVVCNPRGVPSEVTALERRCQPLRETIAGDQWSERKTESMGRMSEPGFWDSDDRFRILGEVEFLDRAERVFARTESLLARLQGRSERSLIDRKLVRQVAQNLYLLETACTDFEDDRPQEAFLQIEVALQEHGEDRLKSAMNWGQDLCTMYRSWAKKRGMHWQELDRGTGDRAHNRELFAVSGFGAHSILAPEAGLHVLEMPRENEPGVDRCRVRVCVAPHTGQPPAGASPAERSRELLARAKAAFADQSTEGLTVVRSYRRGETPSTRDAVRGWRTSKVERVLAGDFDVIGASSSNADPQLRE